MRNAVPPALPALAAAEVESTIPVEGIGSKPVDARLQPDPDRVPRMLAEPPTTDTRSTAPVVFV